MYPIKRSIQPIVNILSTILFIAILGTSCQKVIPVKLTPGATKYVIEGVINDLPGSCKVSITTTKEFSDDNSIAGVAGAAVTIESGGNSYTLTDAGNGIYSNTSVTGQPGKTYKMTVNIKGAIFTATSTMPQPVTPDTVYVGRMELSDKLYAFVVFTDPAGVPNYYRWVQYVNGRKEPTIFASSDEFTDGLTLKEVLNFNNGTNDSKRDIHTGDSVRIDMFCIDAAVYKYWYSLDQEATGSGDPASPANPVGNITGGCLGYFSAQTYSTRTIIAGK